MFRTESQHAACASCPVAKTADLIGDSITLLIIRDLAKKPRRFSDLETSFPGVSTRTLTKKLQTLEIEKLITKEKYAEFPPRVEYSLTKKGKGLVSVIKAMEKYGEKFLKRS
jgi:DNA-binding HxlR family transcriptional regulator